MFAKARLLEGAVEVQCWIIQFWMRTDALVVMQEMAWRWIPRALIPHTGCEYGRRRYFDVPVWATLIIFTPNYVWVCENASSKRNWIGIERSNIGRRKRKRCSRTLSEGRIDTAGRKISFICSILTNNSRSSICNCCIDSMQRDMSDPFSVAAILCIYWAFGDGRKSVFAWYPPEEVE